MNVWHRRFVYLQLTLLVVLSIVNFYSNIALFAGLVLFTLLEFAILQKQRNENKNAVFYAKSCYFAMFDLLSVVVFIGVFWMVFYFCITGYGYHYKYLPVLFAYTIVRKFYIIKNYSYEK